MSDTILIVDDEEEIADLIEVYLKNEDYTVLKCGTAKEALAQIDAIEIDLAILDVMLPDSSGFVLCQKIREHHRYPVIMLTAKEEETDKITGLTLGADDYMTKPFRPLELIARVKAQLRRYKRYNLPLPGEDPAVLSHAGLVLNQKTHTCELGDRPISLTPTEFAILQILLERKGEVIGSEEIFHAIWKDQYYSKSNNTIPVHIRHLREKLNDSTEHPKYIKTIWGVGYKIEK
ncbi:MAG: VanR-ABDEGLN family DNA-binding response regulator [Oscillospiraceae bacterium]|nr:MAG: VanR-ABDEGLN family DNA-binding response regulator [Oscillospiraceae bacterium]